jgi:hypothetical protein
MHEGGYKCQKILARKLEGKTSVGKPRSGSKGNIKVYLRGIGIGMCRWINLPQDGKRQQTIVDMVINLRLQKRQRIS